MQPIARPRCGSGHITGSGFRTRPIGRLPMFERQTRRRYFSRTVDHAAAKHLKKLDLFVPRLSQLFSFLDAAELFGSLSTGIGKRVARIATVRLVQRNRRLHVQD